MRIKYIKDEFTGELQADFNEIIKDCKESNIKLILSLLFGFMLALEFGFILLIAC